MIRTTVVKYKNIDLICRGYHSPYKDNGPNNQPEYECFEIDSVYYNDTDVTELLDALNFDWSKIECLCLESLKD